MQHLYLYVFPQKRHIPVNSMCLANLCVTRWRTGPSALPTRKVPRRCCPRRLSKKGRREDSFPHLPGKGLKILSHACLRLLLFSSSPPHPQTRAPDLSVGTAKPPLRAPNLIGTAGPQQRAPDLSGHCRTSTANHRSQWALLDLNSELQISLGTAGPQRRAPDLSGHCRTSTASSRSPWALPDHNSKLQISVELPGFNCELQISVWAMPHLNSERQISVGTAGLQ